MLYADDICIVSLSSSGFQHLLNICNDYCERHDLSFNAKKSMCMYFSTSVNRGPEHCYYYYYYLFSVCVVQCMCFRCSIDLVSICANKELLLLLLLRTVFIIRDPLWQRIFNILCISKILLLMTGISTSLCM